MFVMEWAVWHPCDTDTQNMSATPCLYFFFWVSTKWGGYLNNYTLLGNNAFNPYYILAETFLEYKYIYLFYIILMFTNGKVLLVFPFCPFFFLNSNTCVTSLPFMLQCVNHSAINLDIEAPNVSCIQCFTIHCTAGYTFCVNILYVYFTPRTYKVS